MPTSEFHPAAGVRYGPNLPGYGDHSAGQLVGQYLPDAAGAIVDSTTAERARAQGLDPQHFLDNNDSYHFFSALDDLVRTGPTGTNVGDVQVALIA